MPQGREWEYARQQGRQQAAGAPPQAAGAPPQRFTPERRPRTGSGAEPATPASASPESQVVGGLTTLLGGIMALTPWAPAAIPMMALGSSVPAIDKAARTGEAGDVGAAAGAIGQVAGSTGAAINPPTVPVQPVDLPMPTYAPLGAQPPAPLGGAGVMPQARQARAPVVGTPLQRNPFPPGAPAQAFGFAGNADAERYLAAGGKPWWQGMA